MVQVLVAKLIFLMIWRGSCTYDSTFLLNNVLCPRPLRLVHYRTLDAFFPCKFKCKAIIHFCPENMILVCDSNDKRCNCIDQSDVCPSPVLFHFEYDLDTLQCVCALDEESYDKIKTNPGTLPTTRYYTDPDRSNDEDQFDFR